ncbi:MAG TPA: GatB/YqeY domain-containing protein, partial [Thermoleophilaceae bacterium]|nr:GatB/YqeY domain-containing protein [Thermoleophilaceae bacterium]
MAVVDQVQEDARSALKAGDRERAGALRLIASELQKAVKDGGDDEVAVLQRERKRRLESAAAYRDGGRDDLATA